MGKCFKRLPKENKNGNQKVHPKMTIWTTWVEIMSGCQKFPPCQAKCSVSKTIKTSKTSTGLQKC